MKRRHFFKKTNSFGVVLGGVCLVQGVCGAPIFDSPGTATEGLAFFLLMEAARNQLYKKKIERASGVFD